MNDDILLKATTIYREFVDIVLPCKTMDFNIRGILLWAREHATAAQKRSFLIYFYGDIADALTGAFQIADNSAVIYKQPFTKEYVSKLTVSKLFDIFEISGCSSEFFSIYFLEYKRVSKIRSRAYMNKLTKNREEYMNFIRSIIKT